MEFPELGERIAKAAGVPFFGGGKEASATINRETGKRSIVASLRAHGTGKNLTLFSRVLFVNPPADGAEVFPRQLPLKDGQPDKVISGYRWTHVELNDEQFAQGEQARKEKKLPTLTDALS
ncbi:hypothetical protein POL68_25480 [Stigmatella sp. ncwal1]|uniref:Uncharacterized protein n=1 Tax=Stigmatella ashevillensis TaxID=2995309 RepID=A0ABT5DEB7_9BACT|nr:hypothetical protein [Stigmatella ashevillena]MDC0711846.1 hypothetical protein [Stigmatella ashevillena]